jgi:TonB family protein
MTALRHILMSTGLHGTFAVVVALLLFGAQAMQEHPQTITVHLIEAMTVPVAEPTTSGPTPKQHAPSIHDTGRADSPRPRHIRTSERDRSRVLHAVATPTSKSTEPPSQTFISPSRELAPVFLEIRRSSHESESLPTTVDDAMTLPIDTISSPSTLSSASIVPPLFRPVMAARTESRPVLRDFSAETTESVRSKARSGQNLRPDYPRTAQEAGWEGTVMLRVEVLPDGNAGSVSVQRTSGHAILDDAALTAVQRWHFSPAMDGNFPIRSVVHLPVKFDLMTP